MTTPVANLEMAEAWDGPEGDHWTVYADHYERVSWRHNERLLEQVGFAADASVLDVGCGTGRSTTGTSPGSPAGVMSWGSTCRPGCSSTRGRVPRPRG